MVGELFVSNCNPLATQIDHVDGDKSNNCASNLRWVTDRENKIAKYDLRRKLGLPIQTERERIALAHARAKGQKRPHEAPVKVLWRA